MFGKNAKQIQENKDTSEEGKQNEISDGEEQ